MLEVISKPRLRYDSGVASLFKMLTYSRVCCAFSSACALLSDLIQGSEITSTIDLPIFNIKTGYEIFLR
jgi:hypothetical protein